MIQIKLSLKSTEGLLLTACKAWNWRPLHNFQGGQQAGEFPSPVFYAACLVWEGQAAVLNILPPLWKRRTWYRYSHFEELPETILSCLLPVLRIIPTEWNVSISGKLLHCSTSFHRTAPSQKIEPQQHCQVLSPTDFWRALIIYLLALLQYHPTPKEQNNYYKPRFSWSIWAVIATLTLSKRLIAFRLNTLAHACAVVISCPSQR